VTTPVSLADEAVSPDGPVIEVSVERPAVGGRMIARHEGRVVLVDGAIPGERVRARVERASRSVLFARTIEVLDASPDRRPVAVPPVCGGRGFAHIAYARQVLLKGQIVQDAFRRIGRIDLPEAPRVVASPERGYRMRARLHVGDRRVGFLEAGSHRVCEVAGTGQLLPKTEQLIAALGAHAPRLASVGVRTVELAEDLSGDQCVLHLVAPGDLAEARDALMPLASVAGVSGLTLAGAGPREGPLVLAGGPAVADRLDAFLPSAGTGTLVLQRHAAAFFQANRYLVPDLVAVVVGSVTREVVVDLYAGVGLFAVCVGAARGGRVSAVERDPSSARDLVTNAAPMDPTVQVIRAPVETFLKRSPRLGDATVILDPPRAGLSREVVTRLVNRRPSQIVYVSCDVATQARDLRALCESGYRLDQVQAFDMFPNTAHIETVVSLDQG